ncbi:unnamed protein product [[Actinomadura] parvosata subsp. kistnae]|nr:unnamed protein product [Actinomadura parvosata subsp. kistnae]
MTWFFGRRAVATGGTMRAWWRRFMAIGAAMVVSLFLQ